MSSIEQAVYLWKEIEPRIVWTFYWRVLATLVALNSTYTGQWSITHLVTGQSFELAWLRGLQACS